MTGANLGIQSFSLAVTLLLLLCNRFDRERNSRLSHIMNCMLWTNAALLLCYLVTRLLEGHAEYEALDSLLTCGKCGLAYLVALFYTDYVCRSLPELTPASAKAAFCAKLLCCAAMALNVLSIFNHMYFSCEGGVYRRGPLFLLNQALAGGVLLLNVAIVLRHRGALGRRAAASLLSYAALPGLAVPVQIPIPEFDTMCIATTFALLVIYVTVHVDRGRQLAEKEKELTDSRMAVMLSQIQPHFLYNTLAVIQDMCHGKAPEAEQTTVEFAEFLRGNLDSLAQAAPVPFEQELRHTRNYLTLERKRFGELLQVYFDIRTTDFALPALTLQPIVENAVRYGVMRRVEGGTVKIGTAETDDAFVVTVADNGVGFDPAAPARDGKNHIGIPNVRGRLENMCGGSLTIRSAPGAGTTAVIRVPKQT